MALTPKSCAALKAIRQMLGHALELSQAQLRCLNAAHSPRVAQVALHCLPELQAAIERGMFLHLLLLVAVQSQIAVAR